MQRVIWGVAIAVGGLAPGSGHSAEPLGPLPPAIYAQCLAAGQSPLLFINDPAQLRVEIDHRYIHSVEVAAAEPIIYSSRPAFTWAHEAKAACGIAIGYLKSGTVDPQFITKCDCFHERMVTYLP